MQSTIHIVEDNLLSAESLKQSLERMSYVVSGVTSSMPETMASVDKYNPDLLIVDIDLNALHNGIDIVNDLRKKGNHVPVIYLTGSHDACSVQGAVKTKPKAYLSKPLLMHELLANINLIFQQDDTDRDSEFTREEPLFIPDQNYHLKLMPSDIYYVEADGSYIKVFTSDRKYQLTSNLSNFSKQLNNHFFIRVSRKHLINKAYVDSINGNMMHLGPYSVQMAKTQRQEVLDHFKIFKSKV